MMGPNGPGPGGPMPPWMQGPRGPGGFGQGEFSIFYLKKYYDCQKKRKRNYTTLFINEKKIVI